MKFFDELKRRNVFKVGAGYAVLAWLLAQGVDVFMANFGAPEWVTKTLLFLLVAGFPLALFFAWAFELTPDGIKTEAPAGESRSIPGESGRKLNFVVIGILVIALGYFAWNEFMAKGPDTVSGTQAESPMVADVSSSRTGEAASGIVGKVKSVAVLPFANRSNQDDDLFFTDGIHDDLLTQLAKIHDLTVISRTSVMEYRDTSKNLKEIGTELNVGNILEGGIQKVGDRVRINVQLIEVATDVTVWAETFDRELSAENIFDIQSEIARKIVQAVEIQLTPEEEHLLSEVPTQNLAAYEAYLRARDLYYGANYAHSKEAAAQPWLEKAIDLDPKYAQAYAMLADVYGQIYWRGLDTSDAFVNKYRATIDQALLLNPQSPTALRASASYYYRVENDYQKSLDLVNQALRDAPGNVDLQGERGFSLRRLGRWEESIASFRRALDLDPNNRFYRFLMVETMAFAGQWQAIIDTTVPLEDADPDDLDVQIYRAVALMNQSGDLEPLEQVFEHMHLLASTVYARYSARVYWLKRDADATIEVLNNSLWTTGLGADEANLRTREYQLANAYRLKGEQDKANQLYEEIIAHRDEIMGSALQVKAYGGLNAALSLAWLGRFDEAMALAAELTGEITSEKDSMLAGYLFAYQAMIKGLAGEQEAAVDDLTLALQIPAAARVTVWDLYYDPNWDFMRDNPRFVSLATPEASVRAKAN